VRSAKTATWSPRQYSEEAAVSDRALQAAVRCPWLVIVPTPLGATALLKLRLYALRRKPPADRSGGRGWIKTKNRDYWRWEMEREGALQRRRERQFV
jgi:hypothetical protein